MRLGIIGGAGLLGANTAFFVASSSIMSEIVLYDLKDNVAKSHAMDIEQAVCEGSETKLCSGTLDDLAACDIILNTAGVPERVVASRDDFLAGNIEILRELAARIRSWGTSPVFVSATNPIDVLNYKFFEMSGLPAERFVGFSRNDMLRFKWAVSAETGIPANQLEAIVIGEHGDGQVPIFGSLRETDTNTELELSETQKASILNRVKTWFGDYQALDSGRSSGWTSGVGLNRIISMIVVDDLIAGNDFAVKDICSCSVIPNGQYGLCDLSIGLPVRLGHKGVREIVEIDLTNEENAALQQAAEKIKRAIKSC